MTEKLILSKKSKEILGDSFLTRLSPHDLNKKINEAYLGILTDDSTLFNPFGQIPSVASDKFTEYSCYLMTQPDYFYFILKYIFQIDSFPQQCLILKEMYTHRFPLLIGSRGLGKSFALALYMLIKMIIQPGTQCIITSAGFRQSKVVFEYMERIWKKSLVLQNCFKSDRGGTHGTDVWSFRLGDSCTYALPIGPDGSKVRGYRANCVHPDTLVQTDSGLVKIKDYSNKKIRAVINMNRVPEEPKTHYKTEPIDVYELTTENGYSIRYSKVHQLYTDKSWIAGTEFKSGDTIYLDNNDFFPNDYAIHNGLKLTESELFYSGIINLSTLSAKEVPWYILQSPRKIVMRFLNMFFGQQWLGKKTSSPHREKVAQLQVLLLKFNYISKITYNNKEYILEVTKQHLTQDRPVDKVVSVVKLDTQEELYDFELLETNSFLGGGFINHNCLISDEFSTVNRQVFEEVMSGFLSVASSPVEQIKHNARQDAMKKLNIPIPKSDNDNINFMQNQLILSGTAYYKINHFYHYFQKWHSIIEAKKNPKLLKELFENDEDANSVNPDDYSIIRIPIEFTNHGYMDMAQINRIKLSTTKDVFLREYKACFSDDSTGFYKKGLIDSCTVSEGDPNIFPPTLYGNVLKKYVFGVDPAYQGDNFAIVILEINGNHRRVVHCWTIQASDHKRMLVDKIITENDYYHFCARKIRDLMKRFPCEYIAIDKNGGGQAVMEALTDKTKLKKNEVVLLPVINPEEKTKDTDIMDGKHMIHVITPNSEWNSQANYFLKKDMEDKSILFPMADVINYALAEYYDENYGEYKDFYDTLDDCIFEIEELKKELTTVVVTETGGGKEKFDTPTIKLGINRKGRLKKDRYSALLMANFVARNINGEINRYENPDVITLFGYQPTQSGPPKLFRGCSVVAEKLNKLYNGRR